MQRLVGISLSNLLGGQIMSKISIGERLNLAAYHVEKGFSKDKIDAWRRTNGKNDTLTNSVAADLFEAVGVGLAVANDLFGKAPKKVIDVGAFPLYGDLRSDG